MHNNDIIFEKRTNNSYTYINIGLYNRIFQERKKQGYPYRFSGSGIKIRTYETLPKHKFYDFLRKAFEECKWKNIKKFRFKDFPNIEQHVDGIYWDYFISGYVLMLMYHDHLENGNTFHDILLIEDINSLEPEECFDIKNIEIIETIN
jgi:hypothetical protein